MVPRILAFRPAIVMERLAPRSNACPLSGHELLAAASALGVVLPIVRAPIPAVARATLVAAAELRCAVGLALPSGDAPERWFAAVTEAADEVAAGLPVFLCAELAVEGASALQIESALGAASRLVGAGLTLLALDVGAIVPGERGRVLAELVAPAREHGIGVEAVLPLADGAELAARAAAAFEETSWRGAAPDVASVRCPAPAHGEDARLQVAALARVCDALPGVPLTRRGPLTAPLLELIRRSALAGCEDGGSVSRRTLERMPAVTDGAGPAGPGNQLRRAAALSPEAADRLEACAYVDAMELMERLGARGTATALTGALERRLEDP